MIRGMVFNCLFCLMAIEATEPTMMELDWQTLIESPMALDQEIPITISQENKNEYLLNPVILEQERKKKQEVLSGRIFPWIACIAAILVVLVIFLIRKT